MGDQLVREMGEFSFGFYTRCRSEDPNGYHELYLSELEAWLRAKGYETVREKTVLYEHRDRRSEATCSKRGLIDLYAKIKDHDVAVEFDNGKRLKFKSIEKMNNCGADILVGVITGGDDDKSIKKNHQRYSEISTNSSVNRDVWLIVLSERRIELLSTRKNASFDLKSLRAKADNGIRIRPFAGKKEYQQRAIEEY